jgi:hypothetical protein
VGPYVHRDLTLKWAVEAGYPPKVAAAVSRACITIDRRKWTKPWLHFRICGAGVIVVILARSARRKADPVLLGYAVHAAQDAIGHGWILPFFHKPILDDWEAASPTIRETIEQTTKRILNDFKTAGGER